MPYTKSRYIYFGLNEDIYLCILLIWNNHSNAVVYNWEFHYRTIIKPNTKRTIKNWKGMLTINKLIETAILVLWSSTANKCIFNCAVNNTVMLLMTWKIANTFKALQFCISFRAVNTYTIMWRIECTLNMALM